MDGVDRMGTEPGKLEGAAAFLSRPRDAKDRRPALEREPMMEDWIDEGGTVPSESGSKGEAVREVWWEAL